MTPVGFEPTIARGERSQTYALDRSVTGTGENLYMTEHILLECICWFATVSVNILLKYRAFHNVIRDYKHL